MNFPELVRNELAEARYKFPAHHSDLEAYAVLLEEVEEAWADVKAHSIITVPDGVITRNLLSKLAQIAAMAQRWAEDLGYVEGDA